MKNQDFTTTLLIDQSPKEAFDAITNVRGWWSEDIEGDTHQLNGEFYYRNKDEHTCTMRLVEVIPNQKVVWLVVDNYFSFEQGENEWKGTNISFEVSTEGDRTKIRFTHHGLIPEFGCYEVCSNAWTFYIQKSLSDLITKGKGQPNLRE